MATVHLHNRLNATLAYRKHRRWWAYWVQPPANGPVLPGGELVRDTENADTRTTRAGDTRLTMGRSIG